MSDARNYRVLRAGTVQYYDWYYDYLCWCVFFAVKSLFPSIDIQHTEPQDQHHRPSVLCWLFILFFFFHFLFLLIFILFFRQISLSPRNLSVVCWLAAYVSPAFRIECDAIQLFSIPANILAALHSLLHLPFISSDATLHNLYQVLLITQMLGHIHTQQAPGPSPLHLYV